MTPITITTNIPTAEFFLEARFRRGQILEQVNGILSIPIQEI